MKKKEHEYEYEYEYESHTTTQRACPTSLVVQFTPWMKVRIQLDLHSPK